MNHEVEECSDGRLTRIHTFLPKDKLICDSCRKNLKTKKKFYTCVSCDFDICNDCVKNYERLKTNTTSDSGWFSSSNPKPKIVKFMNTDGRRVTLKNQGDRCVIIEKTNRRTTTKTISSFNIDPKSRRYTTGTHDNVFGYVAENFDIKSLSRNAKMVFYENKSPKYPTALHNPDWEFLQNTTIAGIITECLGEQCSFDLARTIASFMTERSIKVQTVLYDSGSNTRARRRFYTFPAQQSVLLALKANVGRRLIDAYIVKKNDEVAVAEENARVYDPDQMMFDNFDDFDSDSDQDSDPFSAFIERKREPEERGTGYYPTPYYFNKVEDQLQIIDPDALAGDVFCWDDVIIVGTLEEEFHVREMACA